MTCEKLTSRLAVPRWTNKATATAEYPQWGVLRLPTLACAWAAVAGKRGGGQPIPCVFGISEVNRATWVYVECVLAHWPQEDAGRAIKVAATTIESQSLVRRSPTLGKGDAARCATDRVATSTMSKSLVRPFPILNKGGDCDNVAVDCAGLRTLATPGLGWPGCQGQPAATRAQRGRNGASHQDGRLGRRYLAADANFDGPWEQAPIAGQFVDLYGFFGDGNGRRTRDENHPPAGQFGLGVPRSCPN